MRVRGMVNVVMASVWVAVLNLTLIRLALPVSTTTTRGVAFQTAPPIPISLKAGAASPWTSAPASTCPTSTASSFTEESACLTVLLDSHATRARGESVCLLQTVQQMETEAVI